MDEFRLGNSAGLPARYRIGLAGRYGKWANDGVLALWVDDVQKASFTSIDNDTRQVDYVRLGAVAGFDSGTRGTEYFDGFASTPEDAIGLDANALPAPTKTDTIFNDGFESGDFNRWSTSSIDGGQLSVMGAATMIETKEMNLYVNDNTALYVTEPKVSPGLDENGVKFLPPWILEFT